VIPTSRPCAKSRRICSHVVVQRAVKLAMSASQDNRHPGNGCWGFPSWNSPILNALFTYLATESPRGPFLDTNSLKSPFYTLSQSQAFKSQFRILEGGNSPHDVQDPNSRHACLPSLCSKEWMTNWWLFNGFNACQGNLTCGLYTYIRSSPVRHLVRVRFIEEIY
jgi:hypothetical protein